jgi:hypothetical protein
VGPTLALLLFVEVGLVATSMASMISTMHIPNLLMALAVAGICVLSVAVGLLDAVTIDSTKNEHAETPAREDAVHRE